MWSLFMKFCKAHNFLCPGCVFLKKIQYVLFVFSVLVSEGYKAPFIGFIKTGECHVLRQVEVLQPLPSGKKVKHKQL